MIHIDPASPQFEALDRQEQARMYKAMGWNNEAIAEEFEVSETTVKRWTIPGYAEKQRGYVRAWQRSEHGREMKRKHYRDYRASLRAQSKTPERKEAP